MMQRLLIVLKESSKEDRDQVFDATVVEAVYVSCIRSITATSTVPPL